MKRESGSIQHSRQRSAKKLHNKRLRQPGLGVGRNKDVTLDRKGGLVTASLPSFRGWQGSLRQVTYLVWLRWFLTD